MHAEMRFGFNTYMRYPTGICLIKGTDISKYHLSVLREMDQRQRI